MSSSSMIARSLSSVLRRAGTRAPAMARAARMPLPLSHALRTSPSGSIFSRFQTNESTGRPIPVVTYELLKPWTQQPSLDRAIIDVREVHEVEQGSIPSAVNVPLSVLPQALAQTPDAFRNTYGFERPEKHQEIIFYCRSGKRSTTASELAQNQGWKNVKNYTGSWLDWVEKEQGTSK